MALSREFILLGSYLAKSFPGVLCGSSNHAKQSNRLGFARCRKGLKLRKKSQFKPISQFDKPKVISSLTKRKPN